MAKEVSESLGIPPHIIVQAYLSYWESIKKTIGEYDMFEYDDGDLDGIQQSFNIKHVGKLQTGANVIKSINEKVRKRNERFKYKKGNPNGDCDDNNRR